jgi:hypothetical protein
LHALEACKISVIWGVLQPYEKISTVSSAVVVVAASGVTSLVSHPSVVRFVGHLQLEGLAPRTVEAYVCMIRLLAQWAGVDPALLSGEPVREYFLHLVNGRSYAPMTLRQARAALSCFFIETLGVADGRVFVLVERRVDLVREFERSGLSGPRFAAMEGLKY